MRAVLKFLVFVAVIGGIAYAGFSYFQRPHDAEAQDAAHGEQQAMPVLVQTATREPVMIWREFSGRLRAVDYAEIRPQVSGTITEIKFEDGQRVEAGDILMVIDPRPYEAALKQAKANLDSAQADYTLAKKELARSEDLIKTKAISARIHDERKSTLKLAEAQIEQARAQVEQAEINLDYAHVKAPIAGRTGRAELTVGNVVQAAGSAGPILTSVVSDEGIYADFEVDEQTYLGVVRANATSKEEEQKIPVEIYVGGNSKSAVKGHIHTFDNRIDPATGTIRARAFFENADNILLPGMFVKVRMGSPSEDESILITEKAIGTDQDRRFVYVVNDQNMVEYRQIEPAQTLDGQRVITDGLEDGDKVIAQGIIKIRPGMPVKPLGPEEYEAMQKQQAEAAAAAKQEGAEAAH